MLVENELNELTKKLLSTKGCSFFLGGIYFASADELQNMFFYQPTFSTIKYHNTRIEYTISWRSKVLYIIDLIPINNDLLSNIKYFNKKVALQFDYTLLVVHQNNCTTKIVNAYIVYDLDSLPKKFSMKFYTKKLFVWRDCV